MLYLGLRKKNLLSQASEESRIGLSQASTERGLTFTSMGNAGLDSRFFTKWQPRIESMCVASVKLDYSVLAPKPSPHTGFSDAVLPKIH